LRHSGTRNVLKVKTWKCVLFSVAFHGLLFGLPVMPKTLPDHHTEEIQLLVLEPPSVDLPAETIPEPVAAPKSAEPPVKQKKPEPRVLRKIPAPIPKPVLVAPVPKALPDSDSISNKPSEMVAAAQPASPPVTNGAPDGTPPVEKASAHSGMANAGGHGPAIESSVGALGGPQFIERSVPRYPRMAQRLGVEGSVLLRLAIDASGKLNRVEVVTGAGNGFDEEAVQAVNRSTFAPAVRNGRPVSCLALLKIRFQLSNQ
jgi:periplasmic protein TonB